MNKETKEIKELLKKLPKLKTSEDFMAKLEEKIKTYNPGIHCDDKDCYACATMRHRCKRLEDLDEAMDILDEPN